MNWFNNLKINNKILSGFILVALIAAIVGAVGYSGMQKVKLAQDEGATIYLPSVESILIMSEAQTTVDSAENALLNEELTGPARQEEYKRITAALAVAEKARAVYEPLPQTPNEKAAWEKFVPAWSAWTAGDAKFVALSKQFDSDRSAATHSAMVRQALEANALTFAASEDLLNQISDINVANSVKADKTSDAASKTATTILLGAIILAFALSIILGTFISHIISKPLRHLALTADKLAIGEADVEVRATSKDEIGQLMGSFGKMVENIQNQAAAGSLIASGDLTIEVVPKSDKDVLAISMKSVIETLRELVAEAAMLTEAAVEGRLDTRGDASKFSGGFKEIIDGVNQTLDAVIGPLNVAGEYVERISKGDIPSKITDSYNGDFNEIKNNLNTCIDAINELVEDADMLASAAVEGRLDTRADSSRHGGDFAKIVNGVNHTLDAVIGPLNVAAEYVERISKGDIPAKITENYNGDFNEIKNNLNTCIDAVNDLVSDADMLVTAAVEGKLDTRADVGKHGGDFAKIVNGVNQTLDAIVDPLNVALAYIEKAANGEDLEDLENNYKGQYGILIGNLQQVKTSLYTLLEESAKLTEASTNGDLSYRADIGKLKGGYAQIVDGINKTMDAVIEPIRDVTEVMNQISNGNLQTTVKGSYKGELSVLAQSVDTTATRLKAVVGEIATTISEIADGNLALEPVRQFIGDFKTISDSVNTIIDSLNEVLGEIHEASEQVAAGSRQVSEGSQALSQGATEQASSIQELTASISEIATQTKQNAGNANQANDLAVAAKENASRGNNQMKEMLESMTDISDSSVNISKIIKVIDDIAFQTNILALNAAVEAARAGQHGKGFAVVAEEVRNLAARSASAAKETTDLIEGSLDKVQTGTKIATSTAQALDEIVGGIDKVANLVGNIAAASNEQASGIAQVNTGIEQVSQVVQNNSATAEESAAASEELTSQAELLKQQVDRFKLKKDVNQFGSGTRMLSGGSGTKVRKQTASVTSERPSIILEGTGFDKY